MNTDRTKPLDTFLDWTIVRCLADVVRFENEKNIYYRANPTEYPCFIRSTASGDGNPQSEVTYLHELAAMRQRLRQAVEPAEPIPEEIAGKINEFMDLMKWFNDRGLKLDLESTPNGWKASFKSRQNLS